MSTPAEACRQYESSERGQWVRLLATRAKQRTNEESAMPKQSETPADLAIKYHERLVAALRYFIAKCHCNDGVVVITGGGGKRGGSRHPCDCVPARNLLKAIDVAAKRRPEN